MSYFLCTGTTLAFFHISRKTAFLMISQIHFLESIVTDSLKIVTILIDALLYTCDLLEYNDFIIDNISLSETWKEFILGFVSCIRGGSTLLFFVGVHIEAKTYENVSLFAIV